MYGSLPRSRTDKLIDATLAMYYVGFIAVGALGFEDPSIALMSVLGAGHLIYAVGTIAMGAAALVSVWERSHRSEAVCIVVLGILTVLHGIIIAIGTHDSGGLQTGARLVIALPGAAVLAFYRANTVMLRSDVEAQLEGNRTRAAEHARRDAA